MSSSLKDSKKYDYVIVGSGLYGAISARELTDKGYKCLVLEKREHIGGNCYSEEIENIHVCKYGGHIFHTNDEKIWNYVNKFTEFRPYHHFVRVSYKDKIYSFPINLMTLQQLWGIKTPEEAIDKLNKVKEDIDRPRNLEEWMLSQVGKEIYETFVKGYTKKQWNKNPKELPTFIIKRLPIRLTYENGYFTDKYQGFPENGYTDLFVNLLKGIDVKTDIDYFKEKDHWNSLANKIIFTGKIDEYYDFKFGRLDYRTLIHKNKIVDGDYQGCATINYSDEDIPYTRIVEHKHFQPHKAKTNKKSYVMYEYAADCGEDDIPFYPINDDKNNKTYKLYRDLARKENDVIFGGRLAEYKYYDMHMVVGAALKRMRKE